MPAARSATSRAIDYLAKDYASFRQLLLDRLALLVPDWRERHVRRPRHHAGRAAGLRRRPPELLPGRGRHRGLPRHRAPAHSVRRHARLVDYGLHEGCNARAWVHRRGHGGPRRRLPDELDFLTAYPGAPSRGTLLDADLAQLAHVTHACFEPLVDDRTRSSCFRDGSTRSRSTPGATASAACRGRDLGVARRPGADDAAPRRRRPAPRCDAASDGRPNGPAAARRRRPRARGGRRARHRQRGRRRPEPPAGRAAHLRSTERRRRARPATPVVDRRVGRRRRPAVPAVPLDDRPRARLRATSSRVSVARGNVVLVDHGCTQPPRAARCRCPIRTVAPTRARASASRPTLVAADQRRYRPPPLARPAADATPSRCRSAPARPTPLVARLRAPRSRRSGSSSRASNRAPRVRWDRAARPARQRRRRPALRRRDRRRRRRAPALRRRRARRSARRGHASSRPTASATARPATSAPRPIAYLVGARRARRRASRSSRGTRCRRAGGVEPERRGSQAAARRRRSGTQRARAITPTTTPSSPSATSRARCSARRATLRWTGSWYEALVAVDRARRRRRGARRSQADVAGRLSSAIGGIGHDLEVVAAQYVPLEIELHRLRPAALPARRTSKAALLDVFSDRALPDGTLRLLPSRPPHASAERLRSARIVAAAQARRGCRERRGRDVAADVRPSGPARASRADGVLPLGPLESRAARQRPELPGARRAAASTCGGGR